MNTIMYNSSLYIEKKKQVREERNTIDLYVSHLYLYM